MSDTVETAVEIAKRFDMPYNWAAQHSGRHVCLDGRWYVGSCLVSDPTCDHLARARLSRRIQELF